MLKHFFLIFTTFYALSVHAEHFHCGLATGFPPYQFIQDQKPSGIDVQFFKLLSPVQKVTLSAMPWRDAVALLEFNKLDCVLGMEMSQERKERFHFSPILYHRKIRIFVPVDSPIRTLEDLAGKIVANDRGSELFKQLKESGIDKKIRFLDVNTKDESFTLLMKQKVVAMMGPLAVVQNLSRAKKFQVREIADVGVDIPVAIAFKNPKHPLLKFIDNQFKKTSKKELENIVNHSN